jgi:adenosylcobinamide-GDP ribazoletransferase
MRDALRLSFGTFTALRVSPPHQVDPGVAGVAMLLAPLTAVPLALGWALLGAAAVLGWLPTLVAAGVATAGSALFSRIMHLDGLADTVDGLSSGYDRARALDVMRRGDTGPAGVASLVLTILVQVAALAALFGTWPGVALSLVALVTSRLAPGLACRRGIPAARDEGLGRTVAGSVPSAGLAFTALLVGVVGVVATLGSPWYAAVLVVLLGSVPGWAVTQRAVKRLGGITGDTVGAAIELSLAAALVVASATLPLLT